MILLNSGGSINKPVSFPWKTKDFTVKYQKCVIQTVSEVKFPTSSTIKCKSDAQKVFDKYSKDITSALHTAATRALDLIPMSPCLVTSGGTRTVSLQKDAINSGSPSGILVDAHERV